MGGPRQRDRRPADGAGQSTVEFALITPLVVMCAMALVSTIGLCVQILRLDDAARDAARSAITANEPAVAAAVIARTVRATAETTVHPRTGLVTVTLRRAHRFPFPVIGWIAPRITLTASATMLREPPIVLG